MVENKSSHRISQEKPVNRKNQIYMQKCSTVKLFSLLDFHLTLDVTISFRIFYALLVISSLLKLFVNLSCMHVLFALSKSHIVMVPT